MLQGFIGGRAGTAIASGGGGGGSVSLNGTAGTYHYFGSSGTTVDFTGLTVVAGTHTAIVCAAIWDTAVFTINPTAIWDPAGVNQSMPLIIYSDIAGTQIPVALFGLTGLSAIGNKTIRLSWTGSARVFVDAVAFDNVDQTGGTTSFPNSTSGSGATLAVTSATGNMVVNAAQSGGALSGITGTPLFSDAVNGSNVNAFANYDVGAATVNIGQAGTSALAVATDVKAG
jgi:hypothetical protein